MDYHVLSFADQSKTGMAVRRSNGLCTPQIPHPAQRVEPGDFQVLPSNMFLDRAVVLPQFHQMGGERMAHEGQVAGLLTLSTSTAQRIASPSESGWERGRRSAGLRL